MRIVHLSDLHFGRHDAALAEGLAEEVTRQAPDLVVVSGDFTQVGSVAEFMSARRFIDQLAAPVFAVPGNHDVPAWDLPLRLIDPYRRYRRHIHPEPEPFLNLEGIALAGIKTSRRLRLGLDWSHGSISRGQLERLEARLSGVHKDKLRIVVAHHPLMQPETPMARPMRLVDRADRALATFARLDVRLVLSGHFHMSYVRRHHRVEGERTGPLHAAVAPLLVVQAGSTISTRLRDHRNGYNVIDIEDGKIDVAVREWSGREWAARVSKADV